MLRAVGWHALNLRLLYSLYANARSSAGHFESTLRPGLISGMGAKTDLKCTPPKTGLIIGHGHYLGWAYLRNFTVYPKIKFSPVVVFGLLSRMVLVRGS